MYEIRYTSKFKKDSALLSKRKYKMNLLSHVISLITETGTLPPIYKAHKLSGNFSDTWNCHIKPDWILLYIIDEEKREIKLTATGTHSDLFG
jgi:mRNA interferase YafQ